MRPASAVLVLAGLLTSTAGAQATLVGTAPSHAGKRKLLPVAEEIALARSAAPASVSGNATVMVFSDTGFAVAQRGTNGVTCIVDRSWPASVEPHCYDREGAETMLKIAMHRTLLYHQGRSNAEVDRAIADRISSGQFRLPSRPAMSYMMSEAQVLIGDDGSPAGNWRPHIMIYQPYLSNDAVGFGETPDMKVGMVSDSGKPTASLVIIMPQFVKVVPRTP